MTLSRAVCLLVVSRVVTADLAAMAQVDAEALAKYRAAGQKPGDVERGKTVFNSKKAACSKCHAVRGKERLAGPDLAVVGDKYLKDQLIKAVLEPSAGLHPDYAATIVVTTSGKTHTGVVKSRNKTAVELFDAEGKTIRIASNDIEEERRSPKSLMPEDVYKQIDQQQFADLITYLGSLQQEAESVPGLATNIASVERPVRLTPFHPESMRFDHPVWIIAKPGEPKRHLVIEQQTRKIWTLETTAAGLKKTLFADISHEAITGQFEGVMCLAFHPDFVENGKYYLNYHVREEGIFSPVIVERRTTPDRRKDAGGASRRLLRIKQPTDLHWGGMLAFGPDGYLYIGAGDAGPQEDPDGHGQDLSLLIGKILRIDVDQPDQGRPYGIPSTNPFRDREGVRPEIWAYGFRMPWRFSWDSKTGDMWVGEIGQNLFEEVSIVRRGENHGWNVYEGFTEFSDRYRRDAQVYTPPVLSYRRRDGVSVTGGYVYRGQRSPSYVGAYIFSDFESKKIWAATQRDRKLTKIRQIGQCPEKPSSFGIDHDGELFIVGYEGTIYRVHLDESTFE